MGHNGLASGMCLPDIKDVFDDLLIAPYISGLEDASKLTKATVENAYLSFSNGIQKYLYSRS